MLQYAIYSVISPEGCASILWKSAEKAADAAEAMRITADQLIEFGLIDEVLEEPLGGAHRDPEQMSATLKAALYKQVKGLGEMDVDELIQRRSQRLAGFGDFKSA